MKCSGVGRLRMCCNGSKNTAPQLHAVASTWSSYAELPVQRVFLGIAADLGNIIYDGDATDAYDHAPSPNETYLTVNNTYMEWFKKRYPGKPISRKYVLPVHHSLQGHSEQKWQNVDIFYRQHFN